MISAGLQAQANRAQGIHPLCRAFSAASPLFFASPLYTKRRITGKRPRPPCFDFVAPSAPLADIALGEYPSTLQPQAWISGGLNYIAVVINADDVDDGGIEETAYENLSVPSVSVVNTGFDDAEADTIEEEFFDAED